MSDYQVIIHQELLPDGVSVEDVFMAVEVRPVQPVEIKPYLDRLVEACRVLSGHIDWDGERRVMEVRDIVQGHVTGYRQDRAPEMYDALKAVKHWSFAEAELEELRGKAKEIDAALTEAQKQIEVLRDAGADTAGDYRRALQSIYDLTNKNFPADLQTRMDAIRRIAAAALENRGADESPTATAFDRRRNYPCVLEPVEHTPALQEALEIACESLKNAWKERDDLKSVVDAAHSELDAQGIPRLDWSSPYQRHELTLVERIRVLRGRVKYWYDEAQTNTELLHALRGRDDQA